MGLLSDFFISTETDASLYDGGPFVEEDRAQYKQITSLELSMLYAILQDCEWNVDMMDEFECIRQREDGEEGIWHIPSTMIEKLVSCSDEHLWKVAQVWANTEELQWDASDAKMVLDDLIKLAQKVKQVKKNLYLWNCL